MCFICADIAEEQRNLFSNDDGTESDDSSVALCQLCYQDYLAGRLKLDFFINGLG